MYGQRRMARGGRRAGTGPRHDERGTQPDRRKRSVFTKLMKDRDASMRDEYQARRFIEGMETYDSKAELLARLQDEREMGKQRIRDVLSFTNSTNDVEVLLIPLLRQLMSEETSRPMYRPLRDMVLLAVYNTPRLMDVINENNVVDSLSKDCAIQLCSFLRAVTKAFLEPRKSTVVHSLAKALRDRSDVEEARILCSLLLVDETEGNNKIAKMQRVAYDTKPTAVACWVSDTEPPGGRHDNDHRNYRDIRIVPTAEELTCEARPYLPLASGENIYIEDPVAALLDRNFRLLREDAVSSMRESLAEAESKGWKNARIIDISVSTKRPKFSVSFVIQCDSRQGGFPNWKRSRALMHGSVVALCRGNHPVRMGTVVVREDSIVGEWLNDPGGPKVGVLFETQKEFSDSINEMVKNCVCNEKYCKGSNELRRLGRNDPRRWFLEEQVAAFASQMETYDLVEISKSFFAYQPILRTLQRMEAVPLSDCLIGSNPISIAKPDYIPNGISLPKKDFDGLKVNLDEWSTEEIVAKTSLDKSQADALKHALTSRVALTQGPPGTGKTFIGALEARVIRENTDESILCVCYTNHALDQFLEHMLDAGENRIVRIGGRSKSERLAGYQLKELARKKAKDSNFCERRIKQVHANLFRTKEEIEEIIKVLKSPVGWKEPSGGIQAFLRDEEPQILEFLRVPDSTDEEGFHIVGSKGKQITRDFLWEVWEKGEAFPEWLFPYMWVDEESYENFEAFWNMPSIQRGERKEEWRREIMQSMTDDLTSLIEVFNSGSEEDQSLNQQSELEILREARIIGATTSGAAAYNELLSSIAPGVVMVEEAGEVLESHILTSLSWAADGIQSTKHLILIGDHKQLPPKVENYELTTTSGHGYNLDCSLFERLVLAGQPSVTLEVQHRMRPSISTLIRTQTYPNLRDHQSVTEYPQVKGISKNLLFIDHDVMEDGADAEDSTTKSNKYEAELCVEIVRFLLLQEYKTTQIVVLTPYLGQLLLIMARMKTIREVEALVSDRDIEQLEELNTENDDQQPTGAVRSGLEGQRQGVRCSSIDNYQGEEADIIVIALVRSNKRGNIGFLKERQRVNVLLSRARHGMYLVGNSATLLSSGKGNVVWRPIIEQLSSAGCVVKGLPTICQLHPKDDPIELIQPSDFRYYRPNGGCCRPCGFRLQCGHACPLTCHPTDLRHEMAQRLCCEPCKRFPPECNRNHPCSKLCKEECGPCETMVGPIQLPCGHVAEKAKCHDVRSPLAIERFSARCQAAVTHKFEQCGHTSLTTCKNSRSPQPKCPELCGSLAPCQHPCAMICGTCRSGSNGSHDCKQTCSRTLFCGHECGQPCHAPAKCPPCRKPCEIRCSHSFCPKICNRSCSSCVEPCDWCCVHKGQCPLVCGAPCSRLPCNKRCPKELSCGHQCPSVCGEDCPSEEFCQQCGSERHQEQVVDMIKLASYRGHDVNDDPIIFLPCGHFFAMSSMDGIIELHKAYRLDHTSGEFTAKISLCGNEVSEKSKQCPDCRAIIHSVRRYGRLLRLVELRSLERKHMAEVNDRLQACEKLIRKSAANPIREGRDTDTDVIAKKRKQIISVLDKLEHQTIRKSPMNKIFEACGGSDEVESASPPSQQLIRCLELRGIAFDQWASTSNDPNYCEAGLAYRKAIEIADASTSRLSGARLRLSLARHMLKYCIDVEAIRDDVNSYLDWVLEKSQLDAQHEIVCDAQNLKDELSQKNDLETIRAVMSAVSTIGGYNYGTSASDHWFECPNGHPYFIGECGGAMEQSRCPECGEAVGGTSHQLLNSNRHVGGIFHDVLSGRGA